MLQGASIRSDGSEGTAGCGARIGGCDQQPRPDQAAVTEYLVLDAVVEGRVGEAVLGGKGAQVALDECG